MIKYIITRVVWIFIILFVILSMTFILYKLVPEYPPSKNDDKDMWLETQYGLGYYTREKFDNNNPEELERFNEIRNTNPNMNKTVFAVTPVKDSGISKIFYRVSIPEQYFKWLGNVFTKWDWGTSTVIRVNEPAFAVLSENMGTTLSLNIAALLFYLPFGFLFGIIAALKKNTWVDNVMQIVVMVFMAVPSLILILLLRFFLSYNANGMLPPSWPVRSVEGDWVATLGYVIPVLAMSLPAIASLTRMLRAELSEVLTSEYVLLAKTKGLSHSQAVVRHAIRNSMVPMVPVVIGSFAGLLGGSVVMELAYSITGVGRVTLQALTSANYDYNILMVSTAFYGAIGLFTTLIVDISYGFIDPQIRIGRKK